MLQLALQHQLQHLPPSSSSNWNDKDKGCRVVLDNDFLRWITMSWWYCLVEPRPLGGPHHHQIDRWPCRRLKVACWTTNHCSMGDMSWQPTRANEELCHKWVWMASGLCLNQKLSALMMARCQNWNLRKGSCGDVLLLLYCGWAMSQRQTIGRSLSKLPQALFQQVSDEDQLCPPTLAQQGRPPQFMEISNYVFV